MQTIKDRLYAKSAAQNIPLTGAFELSPMCNFACKMCYVRKTSSEVQQEGGLKPLSFWLDLVEQAHDAGTLFPLLTGGEVFVYPHFREIYDKMTQMGMLVSINTNGSCISEDSVKWLAQTPPERVNITLYGGSNETYERLCGDPHGFDRVKKGIQLLESYGIPYRFNCSITPYNKRDLEAMIQFAKSFGRGLRVATYMFPPVRRTGNFGAYGDRLSPEEAAYYQVLTDWHQLDKNQFQAIAANAQHYRELTPELLAEAASKPADGMKCLSGRCSYWIDWQGNLSGCGMFDLPKISLDGKPLLDAWKEIVDWTEKMRYSSICSNCINRVVCHSCAAMVYNETGGFDGRPEYLCELRKYAAVYYKQFADIIPPEDQAHILTSEEQRSEDCVFDEP